MVEIDFGFVHGVVQSEVAYGKTLATAHLENAFIIAIIDLKNNQPHAIQFGLRSGICKRQPVPDQNSVGSCKALLTRKISR